jgi:CRISPR system Cascade subunit CasA
MKFNLTTDPWVPVRWLDGRSTSVSLNELFTYASQIADLAVPPHERISILRLLVCIAQSAHGAPETSDDWDGWDAGLEASVAGYLTKWNDQFHLMGDGTRFLQSPIKDDKDYPVAQMVFHFATGNTPTLLDHSGDDDRELSPAFAARALLVYQNHFVGGSLASKVKGNGPALKALPFSSEET